MHIKKSLPKESFGKISNSLWFNCPISDGAKILYGFLASLPNGKVITDAYILKASGWSQPTLTRRKAELKEAGLILMDRIAPRVHDLYIGYDSYSAEMVKRFWSEEPEPTIKAEQEEEQ